MLKKVNQKGFTIIEVLIVLAIAGVIMLVVFLAVPALQRNSRNTQRNSDASLISAAVNECLTNKNGRTSACAAISATSVPIDAAKIRQLVDANGGTTNITFCGQQGAAACTAVTAAGGGAAVSQSVSVRYGQKCSDTGDSTVAGTARQFAVLFEVENTSGNGITRCLDS